ncbi:putative DNA repair protein Rad26 [Rosellinia necatrix]|uniref:Putative DNA repair protein Rad26 n=1 Tax=Rosellinia necatrix TaxID=77044 RepID=A0A1W2TFY0_ROSNE|nr:putative DNA repair protein Rad26 [Rosellinia necatrix]
MDDFFSDDDLDTLNANALQELENGAIQFTQAQRTHGQPQPPPPPPPRPPVAPRLSAEYDFEDDDLDDAVLTFQPPLPPKSALQPVRAAPAPAPAPVSVLRRPTGLPSRISPQQQQQQHNQQQQQHQLQQQLQQQQQGGTWRPAVAGRLPGPNPIASRASQQIPHPPPPLPRPAPSAQARYQPSQTQRQAAASSHDIAALQAQILDLKSKLTTKDGEISIVRKRLEKSREDHERELHTIKAQTAEQLAKQERAVEAAKAAQESATTELEFTRRDLRDEVVRAKRQDGPGTPKRNAVAKTWGVSDGFEDVEMAGSPSKGKRGKNTGPVAGIVVEPPSKLLKTPTKSKRKRPVIDSPVLALETHSDDVVMLDDPSVDNTAMLSSMPLTAQESVPFNYMKVILSHSAAPGRPPAFEYLSCFKLETKPNESIASVLLRKLSTAGDPTDPTQLPIQFCLEVIRLWDACKNELCLAPITELLSLVTFTLQLQTVALAPYIAPTLLPVAMEACYEVAIPRFNNTVPGDPTDEKFVNLRDNIDINKILSLLYLTALGCATSEPVGGSISSPAVDFWNMVHIHFVLMFLSRKQPVDDFIATLRLLCTSVFPDSIGPINPGMSAEVVAQLLIDRISLHLTDAPRWDVDELKLRDVRLAALQTLSAFARFPFGLAQLAKHDWMIPRLVTLLSACIEELYDGDMQYSAGGEDELTDGLQKLVAHTMLLLHMIVTNPAGGNAVDVSTKLSKTTGGSQRYLLSLSRLNFADDLVSEDTAELAHELLELAVTSEAGEELGEFFSG